MNPTKAMYEAARALIADPAHYRAQARWGWAWTKEGLICDANSPQAACWCIAGAIARAAGEDMPNEHMLKPLGAVLAPAKDGVRYRVARWADMHDHAEALALLDQCISTMGDDNGR
jgi:hypothetical protein